MASGAGAYVQGCSLAQVQEASRAETSGEGAPWSYGTQWPRHLGDLCAGTSLWLQGPFTGCL